MMLTLLVCTKFKYLAETISSTLENSQSQLENLPETHEAIYSSLNKINKCIGLQLLVAISTNLYKMIVYLYRYTTSSEDGVINNTHERIHYVICLSYCIGKLVIYMIFGQQIKSYVSKCVFGIKNIFINTR